MKVLLINGSPHVEGGCTYRALKEMESVFIKEGVECEIINIGNKDIRGCVACGTCKKTGKCIYNDIVNEVADKFKEADGIVFGSPVYYSSPNGTLISFLDRLFYSTNFDKRMKVGASVVSCRRAGNTASFDVLNKYFSISQMPIATSVYWNMIHGFNEEDVEKDLEGLYTMRMLAKNMIFLMKAIKELKEKEGLPEKETRYYTSFPDGK